MEAERGMLIDVAQMGTLFGKRYIRIHVPLDVVGRTHVVAQRCANLLVEYLSCMLVVAFPVSINVMMGLSVIISPVLLLNQ